ncbi:MAG: hypothetical protein ACMZ64_09810 [Oleiphilus sp.]
MPIANCLMTKALSKSSASLIDRWAEAAGISSEHMTINLITCQEQLGVSYQVMATLLLPSMWSNSSISAIQLGLAKALAEHFDLSLNEVHVITHIIESGRVVESGHELTWS